MAFHLYEDTWETTTTTGTSDYALAGAVTGWRPFSAQYAEGDTTWYSAFDGVNFEHGIATYHASTNTLTRGTVLRSTNGGATVAWAAGTKQITVAPLGVGLEQINAQLAQLNSQMVGVYANVGRNLIHNPLFNIQQRGAGPWATSGYTLDRWRMYLFGGDAMSVLASIATDGTRAAIGDEQVAQTITANVTGSAVTGSQSIIYQPIENIRRLAGKTVTVSFWAICNSPNIKIGVSIDLAMGTGGSPSPPLTGVGKATGNIPNYNAGGSWARFALTFTLPSLTGQVLGTDGNSNALLILWLSAAADSASRAAIGVQSAGFFIWGMQLEIGSVVTPLEKPDPRYDLANCQRFYQVGSFNCTGYGGFVGWSWNTPQTMRATPTVVPTFSNSNASSPGLQSFSPSEILLSASATAGPANVFLTGTYTASADF